MIKYLCAYQWYCLFTVQLRTFRFLKEFKEINFVLIGHFFLVMVFLLPLIKRERRRLSFQSDKKVNCTEMLSLLSHYHCYRCFILILHVHDISTAVDTGRCYNLNIATRLRAFHRFSRIFLLFFVVIHASYCSFKILLGFIAFCINVAKY